MVTYCDGLPVYRRTFTSHKCTHIYIIQVLPSIHCSVWQSREIEPKVIIENAGWTMLQKTVNAVVGILWKLHVYSCGQTILEIMRTAVTACLGIALTTRRRKKKNAPRGWRGTADSHVL